MCPVVSSPSRPRSPGDRQLIVIWVFESWEAAAVGEGVRGLGKKLWTWSGHEGNVTDDDD